MWRSSNSVFFSRNTIAERCTHGQVLKLTSMYFVIAASDRFVDRPQYDTLIAAV
jgi:hypothetical protein